MSSALRHFYRNLRTIIVTPSSELASLFWPWPSKNLDALLGTRGAAVVRSAFLATSFALALAGEAAEVESAAAWTLRALGMLRVILEAIVVLRRGYRERGERFVDYCCHRRRPPTVQRVHKHSPTREPPFRQSFICFPYLFHFIPPPPCTFTNRLLNIMYMYNNIMRHIASVRLSLRPLRPLAARGYASKPLDIDQVKDPYFDDVVEELKRRRRKADAKRRQYVSPASRVVVSPTYNVSGRIIRG